MLLIVTSAKPSKLYAILNPLLANQPFKTEVVTPDHLNVLSYSNVKVQLFVGKAAFQLLVDSGAVNGKQELGSAREKLFNHLGIPTLVTYDPSLLDFMPNLIPDMNWDIRLAIRYHETGTLKPKVGDYRYVKEFYEVIDWAQGQDQNKSYPIAIDLETVGLDEFNPNGWIITVQISYQPGHSLVYRTNSGVPLLPVRNQLEALFNMPWLNFIGANLKYDMRWLATHWGLEIKNHKFDTQLVGGLLNENRYNSLKAHCKEYVPSLGGYEDELEDKANKARMDLELLKNPDGFLQYAGGDTDAVLRIYPILKAELCKDVALARFYTRLLHPASIAFRKLETRGILIDKPRYLELKKEAEIEKAQLEKECFAMIPHKIKYKYYDDLSLGRPIIKQDFMFGPDGLNLKPKMGTEKGVDRETGKILVPSTAWEHLKEFIDHPKAGPFVKTLKEYNATSKTLSTYIIGFMEHLRSDGMFHPSYVLAKGGQAGNEDEEGGALTGRSSCKDPAWQTLPKRTAWAKKLRSVVVCPPGYVLVKFDFSQGELRIMADAANCKSMIEAYKHGMDLHALTAAGFLFPDKDPAILMSKFLALSEDEIEKHRYGAKAGNFGLIFRVSPEGYKAFAESSYGVILTIEQANANHEAFFKTYPEIATYHKSQVAIARKYGYVRNQLGRIRHVPLIKSYDSKMRGQAERQAINSPIQGCLFDLMMLTMVEIDKQLPHVWGFGCTHDSFEMYLKEDTWEDDAKKIKQIAENLPLEQFNWTPKVPMVVDFEYSTTNLAEMKKVKISA